MSDIVLGIKLKYDGRDVTGGVAISRDQFRQLASEARRAGEATAGGFTSAAKGVRSVSEQLDHAKQAVVGYLTVTQAAQATRWILDQASAMQQLDARLKVATASAQDYAQAQAGVFEIANRWGAAVEQTAGAFARLNPVIAQLGGNSATTLAMLDGLAASLRLSGAGAGETNAVLLQFSQAMGSGRVSGDEFRSMMEAAEPMMRAVAGELGKTTAELRQMAEDGKLTSSVFGNALLPALDKLKAQAEQIPLGLSQAWQVLENNFSREFGREFNGQATLVGETLKGVSDNAGEIAAAVHAAGDSVVAFGQVSAVVASGAFGAWLKTTTTATYAKVAAQVADHQAIEATRVATITAAEADIAKARTTLALMASERERAVATLSASNATIHATAAIGAHSAALRYGAIAAEKKSAALLMLGDTSKVTAIATRDLAAAEAALAAARGQATVGGIAAQGVMAALGGWIGLATTALFAGATAWAFWGDAAKAAADDADAGLDRVRQSLADQELIDSTGNVHAPAIERARVELAQLREARSQYWQDNNTELTQVQRELGRMDAEIARREARLKQTENDSAKAASKRLSAAGEWGKLTADLKWREKLVEKHLADTENLAKSYADRLAKAVTEGLPTEKIVAEFQAASQAMARAQKGELKSLADAKNGDQAAREASIAGELKLSQLIAKGNADQIEAQFKLGQLTQEEYDQHRRDEELALIAARQLAVEKRQALPNQTDAERKALAAEAAALAQEAANAKARWDNAPLLERKKLFDDLGKSADAYGKQQMEALDKAIAAQSLYNDQIGKSDEDKARAQQSAYDLETAQLAVYAANLRTAASTVILDQAYSDLYNREAGQLDIIIEKRRRLSGLMGDKAVREAGAEAAKLSADAWKKGLDDTNTIGREMFMDWARHGSNAAEKIGESLKAALLSAIYEAELKPVVLQVYSAATGGMPAGLARSVGAANSVTGIGNLLSAGSGLSALYAGYTTGAGAGAMGAVGSALGGLGGYGGYYAASEAAATAAMSAYGGTGAMVGGVGVGSAAAAGTTAGTSIASTLAAIPGWGWAAAVVALVASGALDTIFGGDSSIESSGGVNVGVSGFATRASGYTDYHQQIEGGWFSSDTNNYWTEEAPLAAAGMFAPVHAMLMALSQQTGRDLLGNLETFAASYRGAADGLNAWIKSTSDAMLLAAIPGLEAFQAAGEETAAAVARLSALLSTVDASGASIDAQIAQLRDTMSESVLAISQANGAYDGLARTLANTADVTARIGLEGQLAQAAQARYAAEKKWLDELSATIAQAMQTVASARGAVGGSIADIVGTTPRTAAELRTAIAGSMTGLDMPSMAGVSAADERYRNALAAEQNVADATRLSAEYVAELIGNTQELYGIAASYGVALNATRTGVPSFVQDAFAYDPATNRIAGYGQESYRDASRRESLLSNRRYQELFSAVGIGNPELMFYESILGDAQAWAARAGSVADNEAALASAKQAYTDAISAFADDAEIAVDRLTALREETVAYYQAQQALADQMHTSSSAIGVTLADLRRANQTPVARYADMRAEFDTLAAGAGDLTGAALAERADRLNALANPLLQVAQQSWASGQGYQDALASVTATLGDLQSRLDTTAPVDYQADSISLLSGIDTALGLIETNLRSADDQIVSALADGSDTTISVLQDIRALLDGDAATLPGMAAADGSHADGLAWVPYDNYRARLHYGEAVLTYDEAADWRSGRRYLPVPQAAATAVDNAGPIREVEVAVRELTDRLVAAVRDGNALLRDLNDTTAMAAYEQATIVAAGARA